MAFSMKLQSPDYDGAGNGYEIQLPATGDAYNGDSMAAILALFDADNKIMDFRQLRESIALQGFITTDAATEAGFTNAVQMRDEMRRIRASNARYGKNTSATPKSWLLEGSTGFPFAAALDSGGQRTWGSTTLPADEQDSTTTRKESTVRLIWDKYWDPVSLTYKNLFVYGTVSGVTFNRPGATTRTKIQFSIQFIAGSVKVP